MGIPTTDGRKVWLDESQIHAHKFLSKMLSVEEQRNYHLQRRI